MSCRVVSFHVVSCRAVSKWNRREYDDWSKKLSMGERLERKEESQVSHSEYLWQWGQYRTYFKIKWNELNCIELKHSYLCYLTNDDTECVSWLTDSIRCPISSHSYFIIIYPIPSHPDPAHPIPSYPILSYPILSHSSHLIPSHPISYHIISYHIVSYHTIPIS